MLMRRAVLRLHPRTGAERSPTPRKRARSEWRHATALTGDPKYPEGFPHFDYVNPDAPKGGVRAVRDRRAASTASTRSSTRRAIRRAGPRLSLRHADDAVARRAEHQRAVRPDRRSDAYPADFSSVTFRLRPEARWHDGEPVTAEDVVWSFEKTDRAQRQPALLLQPRRQGRGDRRARGHLHLRRARQPRAAAHHGPAQVLPKHWWEGTDARGRQRDISQHDAGAAARLRPLPDQVASMPGRSIVYERVADYWAQGSERQCRRQQFRRDPLRRISRQHGAARGLQGRPVRLARSRTRPRTGRPATTFPACEQGRVILETFPDKASGMMQAFVPNLRREKFKDPRVRLALNYAWDFERIDGHDLLRPVQAHRQLFRRHGARLLGPAARPRAGDPGDACATRFRRRSSRRPTPTPSAARRRRSATICAKALELLKEAGYELRGRQLVNAETGEPFTIELLDNDPAHRALRAALSAEPRQDRHRR